VGPDTAKAFGIPTPTIYELKLRSLLRAKKLPFKDQVIWYTSCNYFTPDLLVGEKLIIEVDGKIHDQDFHKTSDRIRHRALKNMGYEVMRVRNERIQRNPNSVVEEIVQKYYELADITEKIGKIVKLQNPSRYEPIPREVAVMLPAWAVSFNKVLSEERWSVEFFRDSLKQFHPKLITNQCAMEHFILLLLGLNLFKSKNGTLDFKPSLKFLKRSTEILRGLFGDEGDAAAIHLKNMYNISAPGFFKNLIFKGGPNINPGIISIRDRDSLDYHINNFNRNLSEYGITVESSEIKEECYAYIEKLDENHLSTFSWVREWVLNKSTSSYR
jgi:very-short-patch-repair endonuclease